MLEDILLEDISSNKIKIILTTFKDKNLVDKLVHHMLQDKLTFCVKKILVDTSYIWENAIYHEQEIQLQIKTLEIKLDKLINFLMKNHEYKVPEILILDAISNRDYYKYTQESLT